LIVWLSDAGTRRSSGRRDLVAALGTAIHHVPNTLTKDIGVFKRCHSYGHSSNLKPMPRDGSLVFGDLFGKFGGTPIRRTIACSRNRRFDIAAAAAPRFTIKFLPINISVLAVLAAAGPACGKRRGCSLGFSECRTSRRNCRSRPASAPRPARRATCRPPRREKFPYGTWTEP
jgi:hypothetical protein